MQDKNSRKSGVYSNFEAVFDVAGATQIVFQQAAGLFKASQRKSLLRTIR
jgi:hypothetical protein